MTSAKTKQSIIRRIVLLGLLIVRCYLGCPIYRLFGIVCPGCGLTRAWKYALSGEFKKAFESHLLFPLAPVVILMFFLREVVSRKGVFDTDKLLCAFGILFFVFHLLRLGR